MNNNNKHDMRKLKPAAQEALRKRAVAASRSGMRQGAVCKLFGVSRAALNTWLKAVRTEGTQALNSKKRGRKPGIQLTPRQAAQTRRLISDRCPEQLKLPFALWTREAVGQLIAERCGVALSVWTVGRYLSSWGFSPQKPLRKAFEQDPAAVRRWLESEYPAIREQARAERAEIHWGDEMGLRSDHQTGRSWSRKGRTPVIPGSGQRFRCNQLSTVTNRGALRFMVFTQRFSAKVLLRFLERLLRSVKRKVYLIVDQHPVHKSQAVARWLKKHERRIRRFFLPAYSPELNPDEQLNNDVKSNAVGRRRPRDLKDMLADVRGYLRSTQKQPEIVRAYFRAPSVRYAAV